MEQILFFYQSVTADRLKIKYEVISGFRGLSGTERSGQGFQTGWQGQGEDTGLLYVMPVSALA